MDDKIYKKIQDKEKDLNTAKNIGDKGGQGRAYNNIGLCYYSLGQFDKAIQYLEKYLDITKQTGDKTGKGKAYGNLGLCYHSLGQYDKAIQHHEKHLNIAKQNGDKEGEGKAYCNLANCYYSQGQYDKAIQHHEKHLNIAKQTGDKVGEGKAYGNIGLCYTFLGQYDKAIKHQEKQLNITKQTGDKVDEGKAYGNLGICYSSLGQYDKAIQHHEKHMNIAKQTGDKAGEGNAYGNLGLCYTFVGKCDKAIQHHEKRLDIAKQTGNKAGEGNAYRNLGLCYYSRGQYDKATQHIEKGLDILEPIGNEGGEVDMHINLGACYCSLEQYDKGIQHLEKGLNIAKQIGNKVKEGKSHGNLGNCYYSLGQYDKAELNQKESISCFEEVFQSSPKKDEYEVSIRDMFSLAYRHLTRTLICQDKPDKIKEGLVIEERGRSRALAELMLNTYSVQSAELIAAKLTDICQIQEVVAGVDGTVLFLSLDGSEIYFWVIQPSGEVEFKKHSHGIDMSQLSWLVSNARMAHREPCQVKCEDRSLALLYTDELLEKEERKSVLSLTATPEDVSATESKRFSDYRPCSATVKKESKHMTENPTRPDTDKKRNAYEEEDLGDNHLNQLYQVVLGPVRELIKGSRVVIVPEGELHMIPYAALKDDKGKYVAESLQMRLVPSLATARMMRDCPQQPESGARPLIIGDPATGKLPRLPFAREEAVAIGQLLNVRPLTGEEATKTKVLECIENANLIHIAAHGDMKRGEVYLAPSYSKDKGIAKPNKDDYMLMVSDLESKRLRAKLVVLSCCHSAQGEVKSEGVIGIARAFLGAGARSVLVALWAIDDEATMFFMKSFYGHLNSGMKTNESLSLAMKTMREKKTFCEPKHWAPFVLVGDDITI